MPFLHSYPIPYALAILFPNLPLLDLSKVHHILTFSRIAKAAGSIILNNGGVVRGITNWGVFLLPKPARKLQSIHHTGHHFIMRFDSSAKTQHALRRTMGLDPRLIKYSVVRLGSHLQKIKDVPGEAAFK